VTAAPDTLDAERFSSLGETPLVFVDLGEPGAARRVEALQRTPAIVCGVDAAGLRPPVEPELFDILLTTRETGFPAPPPCPWAVVSAARLGSRLATIAATVERAPIAAAVLRDVLRLTQGLALEAALTVESLAYSTLLGGAEFGRWRDANRQPSADHQPGRVEIRRDANLVTVTLASPSTHNAMDAAMRDDLFGALASVVDDPTEPRIRLAGAGPCFSVGGALHEFGHSQDLARAHAIRTLRSCARLLGRLGSRSEAVIHGACIGAGLEISAAAGRRFAHAGAYFHLPELQMGLIPGAGGTATVPRAIGRHRTAYMALTGRRVRAREALAWGLVHAVSGS